MSMQYTVNAKSVIGRLMALFLHFYFSLFLAIGDHFVFILLQTAVTAFCFVLLYFGTDQRNSKNNK